MVSLVLDTYSFGDVWVWAGKIRAVELNFGVKAYFVSTEIEKLADNLYFWQSNKSFDIIEIATRLHHRAVVIHQFLNGNGKSPYCLVLY